MCLTLATNRLKITNFSIKFGINVSKGGGMRSLDKQERLIVRALIKDPRMSDNQIGKITKVPIKTVNRKRKKLEEEGLLSYYTAIEMGPRGTGIFGARHLYIIKFKMGITKEKLIQDINKEPKIRTLFTELIYESHFAEYEGHTAIIMIVEGKTDDDISENFNGEILPLMLKNHGGDSIINLYTIRLSTPIRLLHNYLPWINIEKGKIKKDWHLSSIFTGN